MNKCEKCGFLHYRTDPCRTAKPTPVQDAKVVMAEAAAAVEPEPAQEAHILRPGPVSRGRPRIHADRKAYKAEHERKRRAKLKAQKEQP